MSNNMLITTNVCHVEIFYTQKIHSAFILSHLYALFSFNFYFGDLQIKDSVFVSFCPSLLTSNSIFVAFLEEIRCANNK